jgi:hypothetical protein
LPIEVDPEFFAKCMRFLAEEQQQQQQQQILRWSERQLRSGKATGAISFQSSTPSCRLNVRYSEGKGRGLFAATNFCKGDVITITPVAAAACSSTALDFLHVGEYLFFDVFYTCCTSVSEF